MLVFNSPIKELAGVGPTMASRLKRLKIQTCQDLIWHLPYRYEDLTRVEKISDIKGNATVSVRGKLQLISSRRAQKRKRMLVVEAIIADESGSLKVVWFNQPYLAKILIPGENLWLAGKVEHNYFGTTLMNPAWEKRDNPLNAAGIIPIYPLTDGLTQKQLRNFIDQTLPLASYLPELLPVDLEQKHSLINGNLALKLLHQPKSFEDIAAAKRRLAFEELLIVHLAVLKERQKIEKSPSVRIPFHQEETVSFVQKLPFILTPGQKRSAWDILQDMDKPYPMNRLLEGDVGSGKTVVAAIAILNVVKAGFQTAYLAPTEILARQHFEKLSKLLSPFGTRVALFTRTSRKTNIGEKALSKPIFLKQLADHQIDLVIGTHALISKNVTFAKLALVIVDEQHRFGVEQRKIMRSKSQIGIPHFLSLTATPIPRTLALTVWGDLSISQIPHLPKERKPIATKLLDDRNRDEAYFKILERVEQGEQAFIICPRIETDPAGIKSAVEEFKKLKNGIFNKINVGLIHGKLSTDKKENAMTAFSEGKTNVLVATAVVEVGIDIPNATVMLIEGADSFGLAQLHQFRGRIGRAALPSICYLATSSEDPETLERLKVMTKLMDGFALAEEDLNRRGPGELWGELQSGFQPFKVARLTDKQLIEETKETAQKLLSTDPELNVNSYLKTIVEAKGLLIHPE
ncbi:MAG: ATP-dependent DNA helicase RecG [Patescibacteria group bacterium]|jgi:ATP-dependent DNA helicase RecG